MHDQRRVYPQKPRHAEVQRVPPVHHARRHQKARRHEKRIHREVAQRPVAYDGWLRLEVAKSYDHGVADHDHRGHQYAQHRPVIVEAVAYVDRAPHGTP